MSIQRSVKQGLVAALVVASAVASALPVAASDYQSQVWNGDPARRGDLPNVALIDFKGDGDIGGCSGTLIRPRVVLTAAHCLERVPGQPVRVLIGGTGLSGGFDEEFFTRVHAVHHKYDPRTSNYDYGLIVLPRRSTIQPVKLARWSDVDHLFDGSVIRSGTPALVAGFGGTSDTGWNANRLRFGETLIRSDASCGRAFATYDVESSMCLDGTEVSGCPGDSGGPVFVADESGQALLQVGITSYGRDGCDTANWRWVAAWVPRGQRWIDDTLFWGIPRIDSRSGLVKPREEIERGDRVRIRGLLVNTDFFGLGFQRVELQRRRVNDPTWRTIQTKTSNRFGVTRFTDYPRRDVFYRVRHIGSSVTRRSSSWRHRVNVSG